MAVKLKIDWDKFVEAAMCTLAVMYPGLPQLQTPEFKQENGYEPDSDCYNFPPSYVEVSFNDVRVSTKPAS